MTTTPPLGGARFDDDAGVWMLGDPVPYADGSEAVVEAIMQAAGDRTSTSDELAAGIRDWPTRYHLSRLRGNLLRPLMIESGARVLDVGAGTGALARHLGERGARVVALEGSVERARAAALRCGDLDEVSVVVGRADDVGEERFDVVLLVGVLEYAGADVGGGGGAQALLREARRLLAPGGALVVAIENQLGLKYLLGYPEDHVGEPWVGLEGYSGGHDVRTWSRAGLATLLDDVGLAERRWLFPFPDYKLPTVTLTEAAYATGDAGGFVDQVVRRPVHDWAHPRPVLLDERRIHRTFVDAGLGPDVANSFVVVACAEEPDLDRVLPEGPVAWVFGGERRSEFMRARRLVADGPELQVEPLDEGTTTVAGWLTQAAETARPYVEGPTLEQLALDAAARDDLEGVAAALRRWLGAQAAAQDRSAPDGEPPNPFVSAHTRSTLPPDHLDVELANFVATDDGAACIDREWEAAGGVDADVVRAQALWYLAYALVHQQARHPFGPDVAVDDVAVELGHLVEIQVTRELLGRWKVAEVELQHVVLGYDRDFLAEQYRRDGATTTEGAAPSRNRLDGSNEVADLAAENLRLRADADRLDELRGSLAGRAYRRVRRLVSRRA